MLNSFCFKYVAARSLVLVPVLALKKTNEADEASSSGTTVNWNGTRSTTAGSSKSEFGKTN